MDILIGWKILINVEGSKNKKSKRSDHYLPRYGIKKYKNIARTGQKQVRRIALMNGWMDLLDFMIHGCVLVYS